MIEEKKGKPSRPLEADASMPELEASPRAAPSSSMGRLYPPHYAGVDMIEANRTHASLAEFSKAKRTISSLMVLRLAVPLDGTGTARMALVSLRCTGPVSPPPCPGQASRFYPPRPCRCSRSRSEICSSSLLSARSRLSSLDLLATQARHHEAKGQSVTLRNSC